MDYDIIRAKGGSFMDNAMRQAFKEQLLKKVMGKAEYSGIHRVPENLYQWCFMLTYFSRPWKVQLLW